MAIGIVVSPYCCGLAMMGNFNYVKNKGPKGLPHYHRGASGGWAQVQKAEMTTEKEIRDLVEHIKGSYGAIIATTGADQEYVDALLPNLGFVRQEFKNRVHEKGQVNVWFLDTAQYRPAPKVEPEKVKEKAK